MLRAGACSISVAILVGTLTLALKAAGAHVTASDDPDRPRLSVWSIPKNLEERPRFRTANLSAIAADPGHIAHLEGEAASNEEAAGRPEPSSEESAASDAASFKARFAAVSLSTVSRLIAKAEPLLARLESASGNEPQATALTRPATEPVNRAVTSVAQRRPTSPVRRAVALASLGNDVPSNSRQETSSSPNGDKHTAIYDIGAHVVYLPDGRRLEAHSGLGAYLDDARFINVKQLGPTPPNVYRLALREHHFHGVRAIRLIPVGGANMFGRDGMLVHTYMLGPNGQSNGCVSIANYPEFLNAFLRGDIDRLVVVEHLDDPNPAGSTIAAGWFTKAVKEFFKPFGA